ncbi:hypothetical protein [Buchananella hordeovulneris]|uniref:hypothetical protein n=1 Tax=Buchananella hordeovulneris TaxID=52770 RepID=UPI000F5FF5C7|nr:hypothetical protein [Buchananella hordeovulneris]RRD43559.1 hypothetical protein EII13_06345 [Buchananella hordeovulneris]
MLIFRDAEAMWIQDGLQQAAIGVEEVVDATREEVAGRLGMWVLESVSRQAQLGFDERLRARVQEMTAVLRAGAQAMAEVREIAQHTEERNVALMD